MKPALRKLTLTAHITFSIGWIGAVAAFLALSVVGLTSHDAEVIRCVYISMNLIGRFVIIPMCFAALATGIIEALCTPWGLIRYYWVILKLGLTLIATILLLMHRTVMARAATWVSGAASTHLFAAGFGPLKTELVQKSALAIALLVGIEVLGVYKPWGLTAYGRRKQQQQISLQPEVPSTGSLGVQILYAAAILLAVVIVLMHLTGHGMGHHP